MQYNTIKSVYLPVKMNLFISGMYSFKKKSALSFSETNLLKRSHRSTDNDCHHISHHITPGKHDSEEMPQISISWVKSSPVCNCNVPLQRVWQESWCRGEISLKYQLKKLKEIWPSLRLGHISIPKMECIENFILTFQSRFRAFISTIITTSVMNFLLLKAL